MVNHIYLGIVLLLISCASTEAAEETLQDAEKGAPLEEISAQEPTAKRDEANANTEEGGKKTQDTQGKQPEGRSSPEAVVGDVPELAGSQERNVQQPRAGGVSTKKKVTNKKMQVSAAKDLGRQEEREGNIAQSGTQDSSRTPAAVTPPIPTKSATPMENQAAAAKTVPEAKPLAPASPVPPTASQAAASQDCGGQDQECFVALQQIAGESIAKAVAAGAEAFRPDLLALARENLQAAKESNNTAEKQQRLLNAARQAAEQAHQAALQANEQQLFAVLAESGSQLADYMEKQLDDLEGPRYMPEDDMRARRDLRTLRSPADTPASQETSQADSQVSSEEEEGFSKNTARILLVHRNAARNAKAVIDALVHNLSWLETLEREVAQLKTQSDKSGGQRLWGAAARSKTNGDENFRAGKEAKETGQLLAAEEYWYQARDAYNQVAPVALDLLDRQIHHLQEGLEQSGGYGSIAKDGTEYPAPQWQGTSFLAQHPLLPLGKQVGKQAKPESRLVEPQYTEKGNRADRVLDNVADDGEGDTGDDTREEGEKNETGGNAAGTEAGGTGLAPSRGNWGDTPPAIYQQAVLAWQQAVEQRNGGKLTAAQIQLAESERLLEEYRLSYAVLKYYVVRERIDCLWVIAGYESIYGNPFQWRRIYRRNTDIIANPRLIYPDQRLVIPPPRWD